MNINCYAAFKAKEELKSFNYDPKELKPWEVEIEISHCGICHSDVHLIDNDWGTSSYPLVPGHEIVGIINNLGHEVNNFQKGQRVGIGWQRSSCMSCSCCGSGQENLCAQMEATCAGNYGGFAEKIRLDSRFVFQIPSNLKSENAAPLLCGGITVYSPLREHVKPYMKIGIIGIGGLGHLALQFGKAFGCEVTAFSSSQSKEAEAKKLGAHNFISSQNSEQMQKAINSLDFILSTVSASIDWDTYLSILKPNGKLCIVGVPDSLKISPFPLLLGQKSLVGSVIGSPLIIQEMLEFAARHSIEAQTETMPMHEVNKALDKVRQNQARYRMVLSN